MVIKSKHMFSDKSKLIDSSVSFHSTLASGWSKGYSSGGFKRRIEFFRSLLIKLVRVESRWLDAGCGSGILAREIGALGASVIAVDAADEMVDFAINEHLISVPVLYKKITTIEKLDDIDNNFDGVFCSSVIEYVDNPHLAIMEFIRVTKPGGLLVISVPNKFSIIRFFQKIIKNISNFFGRKKFLYLDFSINEYTYNDLYNLLEGSGYLVDKIDIFDPILPNLTNRLYLGSLFVAIAHKPLSVSVLTVDHLPKTTK